jgi:Ran GTPase-activating protein (RanGAP) involved in mRNA processing and transport
MSLVRQNYTAEDMDAIIEQANESKSDRLDLSGNQLGEKGGGALADRLNAELKFVKHLIMPGDYHTHCHPRRAATLLTAKT